MKPAIRTTFLTLVLGFTLLFPFNSMAQNKGGPPPWAPAYGYHAKTRHIYFPDYNFYYDLEKSVYIYMNAGSWQIGVKLPSSLSSVDLKAAVQVELNMNDDDPHRHNDDHKMKYKANKNGPSGHNKEKGKK